MDSVTGEHWPEAGCALVKAPVRQLAQMLMRLKLKKKNSM